MKVKNNREVATALYFVCTDLGTYNFTARTDGEAKRIAERYLHKSKMYIELYNSNGEYMGAYCVQGGYWLSKRYSKVGG